MFGSGDTRSLCADQQLFPKPRWCACRFLVPRLFRVVDYVLHRFACGGPAADSTPLLGTSLGLAMTLESDRLYDLVNYIPDVNGLRALRPSAAVSIVMSVPDSRCVRAVTPDDHVSIGFHEILIHDLADEEWPLVTMSELGFLRLDWTKKLFLFMSRYQFDLDQRRKECREKYGSTHPVRLVVNR